MTYDDRPWLKSYDPGLQADIDIPRITLKDMYEQSARTQKDRPAFHFMGVSWTFGQLMSASDRMARALADRGIGRGDVVAVNLPNTPQYLITILGVLRAGASITGLAPLLTGDEIKYQVNDSGAKAVITLDALFAARVRGILDQCPSLKLVVATNIADYLSPVKRFLGKLLKKIPTGDVGPAAGKEVVWFKDLLASASPAPLNMVLAPDDPCYLQYTGGTTGPAKGAVLTHGNIVANITQFKSWGQLQDGQEVYLAGFPMFHQAGLLVATTAMAFGNTQVLIPDPRNIKHIVGEFRKYRPTFLINVPSLFLMLLADPEFRALDFSCVRNCLSGAAPFPVDGIRDLESLVGPGKMVEVYGMTETSPLITANPVKGPKKVGSVGLPLQSTRFRIVDLADGETPVPIGQEGEIIASGPQVMKGYHNRPAETKNALREHDGHWYMHTGDVGRMDEDGFVFVVDRAKDMLNVGGYKVFSSEVEDKLYQHPAIGMCAIIGVPNPERAGSEIVRLVVQRSELYKDKPENEVRADILAFAKEKLAPYKIPKVIEFVNAMPLTTVGKVDKKVLRKMT